jgi:hypothetical protein
VGLRALGGVVVREVATALLARSPLPGLILLEPPANTFSLLLQALHLPLPARRVWTLRSRAAVVSLILLDVLFQQLLHPGFETLLFPLQLRPGAAPLLGGIEIGDWLGF